MPPHADVSVLRCRLCGSNGVSLRPLPLRTCEDLRHLGDFQVFYCATCHNAFTHPLPGTAAATEIKPDIAPTRLSVPQQVLMNAFLRARVQRVLANLSQPAGKTLLDIGSGACAFANRVAAAGFAAIAIEPNPLNQPSASPDVRFVPRLFSEDLVRDGTLLEGECDVITSWHSLEHIPDPVAALRLMHRLLKPGGQLHLSVPNLGSLQARLGGNRWAYLDVPHHLSHFTIAGLTRLVKQQGFTVKRSYVFSAEYEFFGCHQTLLNRVSCSHNYFYNRAKKGSVALTSVRYPRWTRFVNACGPALLPLSGMLALLGIASRQPACVELVCVRDAMGDRSGGDAGNRTPVQ